MSEHNLHDLKESQTSLSDSDDIHTPSSSRSNEQNVSGAVEGNNEKKEHTRSKMALLFVLGFFAVLFLCFIYAIMMNASLSELKDTIIGVVGALSGILGFIVGYYYKSSQEL